MTTTKTAEGPLSKYIKDLRQKLRRPQDEEELPQTVFGRSLGPGRHPSSINRIEQGQVRPSDDFLREIHEAYPTVTDLKRMLDLRDKQFGSEDEWSETRKKLKASHGGAPKKAPAKKAASVTRHAPGGESAPAGKHAPAKQAHEAIHPAGESRQAPEPPAAQTPQAAAAADASARQTAPQGVTIPGGGRPGSLRQRITTPTAPFGTRPAATTSAPPSGRAASERPAPSAPTTSTAAGGSAQAVRGHHATLFAELMPMLQSLSMTLAPASAMRMVAAATVVADRLRAMYAGAQGLGLMDMRAAAIAFSSDLFSLLTGDVPIEALDPAQFEDVRTVVDLSPDRAAAHEDLVQVLHAILSPVMRGDDLSGRLEVLVLRTLVLGARR